MRTEAEIQDSINRWRDALVEVKEHLDGASSDFRCAWEKDVFWINMIIDELRWVLNETEGEDADS